MICIGCHSGHISPECPAHGHLKKSHDAACREYTRSAKSKHDAIDVARVALRRAAYALGVHGAKDVASQCQEALKGLDAVLGHGRF